MLQSNPATAVRGPRHSVKRGKTPVLTAAETRTLLDSLTVVANTGRAGQALRDTRDRALIGVMVCTFSRVGAVLGMRVDDYFAQGRRMWIRLNEKGGKHHEMPCHHALEEYLDAYLAAGRLQASPAEPLFQSARSHHLTGKSLGQPDVWRMLRRRATAAGIATKIGAHTFRATGITTYLQNGGKLEFAQQMANHESPRTTSLYDRRHDQVSLDEVERILIWFRRAGAHQRPARHELPAPRASGIWRPHQPRIDECQRLDGVRPYGGWCVAADRPPRRGAAGYR